MCLSIAVKRPNDVLSKGEHLGFEWMTVHNGHGYRCGYVRVPAGHPWHGKDYDDLDAEVHGGLTFAEPDLPCDKGGADDAHWLGFDCAHGGDDPDPSLPGATADKYRDAFGLGFGLPLLDALMDLADEGASKPRELPPGVRTQEYVESECRRLCEQAKEAEPVELKHSQARSLGIATARRDEPTPRRAAF